MRTLPLKGYGRIYVAKAVDIEFVKTIIGKMDPYELDYMPEGLIALHDEYPKVVYTHKFCDLDMDELTARCWHSGVTIWVFDAGSNEYPADLKQL